MDEEGMQNRLLTSDFCMPDARAARASLQENCTCNYPMPFHPLALR
jgi:hypothetical protein